MLVRYHGCTRVLVPSMSSPTRNLIGCTACICRKGQCNPTGVREQHQPVGPGDRLPVFDGGYRLHTVINAGARVCKSRLGEAKRENRTTKIHTQLRLSILTKTRKQSLNRYTENNEGNRGGRVINSSNLQEQSNAIQVAGLYNTLLSRYDNMRVIYS